MVRYRSNVHMLCQEWPITGSSSGTIFLLDPRPVVNVSDPPADQRCYPIDSIDQSEWSRLEKRRSSWEEEPPHLTPISKMSGIPGPGPGPERSKIQHVMIYIFCRWVWAFFSHEAGRTQWFIPHLSWVKFGVPEHNPQTVCIVAMVLPARIFGIFGSLSLGHDNIFDTIFLFINILCMYNHICYIYIYNNILYYIPMDIYDMFMRIPHHFFLEKKSAMLRPTVGAPAQILLIEHRHLLGSDWHLWQFGGHMAAGCLCRWWKG